MPLRIKCPMGHSLIVSEDRAGRTLRCPRCQQPVVVPQVQKPMAYDDAAPAPRAAKVASLASAKPARPAQRIASEKKSPPLPPAVAETAASEPLTAAPSPEPPVPSAAAAEIPEAPPLAPPIPEPPPIIEPPPMLPLEAEEQPSAEQAAATKIEPMPPAMPAVAPELPVEASAEERESAAFAEIAAPDEPVPPPRMDEVSPTAHSEPLAGIVHDRGKVLVVYQLAAAVVVAALFGMAPAVWDIVEYWRFSDTHFVARWAFMLLLLGLLQIAYAVYVVQLPDWGTVWVVTLYSLTLATLYAMVLGLTLISSEDGAIVRFLQLEDKIAGSKASLWCLCMLGVATLLAFFAGRLSVRWHKTEQLLRGIGY